MLEQARDFLSHCYSPEDLPARLRQVGEELALTGSYVQRKSELEMGARMAWRNSARCIGRLFWKSLKVFDCRHLVDPAAIFDACRRQARWSCNGGKIRPAISVFSPQARRFRTDSSSPTPGLKGAATRFLGN